MPKIVSDRLTYALGLTVTFGIGCEPRAPINDHAQVGEAPVQLVGAGIISTMAPEFATSLSPSGDTLFFNRTSADRSEIALLYSTRSGEAWGSPQPFGPTEGLWAIDPFMDDTGTRLYFSSNLPLEGSPNGNLNLWFVERTGDEWSSPTALPRRINSDSSEVFNTFALDGTMVFSSTRNGVSVIYSSRLEGDGATEPVPIRFGQIEDGSNPAISPDGNLIVFARAGHDEPSDLYVSCREGSGWSAPIRLPGLINSPFADFAPGFAADQLYFTSERPGVADPVAEFVRPPGDIYRTPLEGVAVHCAPGVAQEEFSFVPYETRAYRLINSIAFSPDDQIMHFALLYREVLAHRGTPSETAPETGLFSARRNGSGWTEPQLLSISGIYDDYEPAVTADGTLMVFNSRRPYADGRMPDANDLWMSQRGENGWMPPIRIESITSFEHEESYGTLTADRRLVFVRGRPGADEEPTYDLYESRYQDGAFSAPNRHPVSTDRWGEGDPWISPDGSYLIFTRWDDEIGWSETVDLYISFREAGTWSTPVALEELNTDGPDYGPAVSSDGSDFYYRANSQFRRVPLAPILRRYGSR